MLCVTSWYQLINSEEYNNYKLIKQRSLDVTEKRSMLEKKDSDGIVNKIYNWWTYPQLFVFIVDSSSIEDSSFLEDVTDKKRQSKRRSSGNRSDRDYVEVLPSKSTNPWNPHLDLQILQYNDVTIYKIYSVATIASLV